MSVGGGRWKEGEVSVEKRQGSRINEDNRDNQEE